MGYSRVAVLWVVLGLVGASKAELQLGDPAPPLTVSNWVKGNPVDLTAARGKNVVVVEFWATWCGPCVQAVPHLTELQHRFQDQGVVVLGVTAEDPRNPLDKVTQFVKDQGDKMNYTVAFDAGSKTYDAFMTAAGQDGIPTAFVVDKQGRIAWIGHPEGGLDETLNEVLAGTYDIELAKKLNALRVEEAEAWGRGDFGALVTLADKRIALKPNSGDGYFVKFKVLDMSRTDDKAALAAATKAAELWNDNADELAQFAPMIARRDDTVGFNVVAKKAMARARELKSGDSAVLIAEFKVLSEVGDDAGALTAAEMGVEALRQSKDAPGLARLAQILSDPDLTEKCSDLALKSVELALQIDPENPLHLASKFKILAICKRDVNAAKACGSYLVEKTGTGTASAVLLNEFAWDLLTEKETMGHYSDLALQAAEKCDAISGSNNWAYLDTLALALFETGRVQEAVAFEQKALEFASKENINPMSLGELEKALARFQAAASSKTN